MRTPCMFQSVICTVDSNRIEIVNPAVPILDMCSANATALLLPIVLVISYKHKDITDFICCECLLHVFMWCNQV
jgi:hypothetical protein